MAKHIQIRNVPEEIHRKLKSRAALAGASLSEFLLRELELLAEKPTFEEIRERLASLEPIDLGDEIVDILREERDRR